MKQTQAKGDRLIPAEMTAATQERIAFNLCDEFGSDFVAANQRFAKAVYAEVYSAGRPTGTEAGRGVGAEAELAASVAETVKETGGWWKSCTGCHETNEGHETGHYSYSRIFRCHVGSGCSECGGLGVRWEHDTEADFAAMAAEFATTPPVSPSPDSTTRLRVTYKELIEAADDMLNSLPPHWHDDATVRLMDARDDAREAIQAAEQDDLYALDEPTPDSTGPADTDAVGALITLVDELCASLDNGAEDIGGDRKPMVIIGEIGPALMAAKRSRSRTSPDSAGQGDAQTQEGGR